MSNGALPASALALIPNNEDVATAGPQYIAIDALPYFLASAREFRQETGQKVYVAEGYRTLEKQIAYFLDRYFVSSSGILWRGQRWLKKAGKATAAVPGTSPHGNALALDIWSGIDTSFTSPNHQVWVRVSAKYGWKNTGTGFGEPWHQEWARARVSAALPPITNVNYPSVDSAGSPIVNTPSPEHQEEEAMTTLVTSPSGQSLVVPGIGHVAMSPSDVRDIKSLGGPQIQTLSVSAALHSRIQLASALRNDSRILFLIKADKSGGGGYALYEDRQFTIVGSMDTVNALTRAGVATVTMNGAEFKAIIQDLGASRPVVVTNSKDFR